MAGLWQSMSEIEQVALNAIRWRDKRGDQYPASGSEAMANGDRRWLLRYIDRHIEQAAEAVGREAAGARVSVDSSAAASDPVGLLRERIGLLRAGLEPDDAYVYTKAWLRGTEAMLDEEVSG